MLWKYCGRSTSQNKIKNPTTPHHPHPHPHRQPSPAPASDNMNIASHGQPSVAWITCLFSLFYFPILILLPKPILGSFLFLFVFGWFDDLVSLCCYDLRFWLEFGTLKHGFRRGWVISQIDSLSILDLHILILSSEISLLFLSFDYCFDNWFLEEKMVKIDWYNV